MIEIKRSYKKPGASKGEARIEATLNVHPSLNGLDASDYVSHYVDIHGLSEADADKLVGKFITDYLFAHPHMSAVRAKALGKAESKRKDGTVIPAVAGVGFERAFAEVMFPPAPPKARKSKPKVDVRAAVIAGAGALVMALGWEKASVLLPTLGLTAEEIAKLTPQE